MNQQINYSRQNVFTLTSTLFWGLLHFVLFLSFWYSIIVEQIHVFIVIRFSIIFSHFIKSLVTIIENRKNLPELFSDTETNNRSSNFPLGDIHPRQETVMPFVPFRQNARYLIYISIKVNQINLILPTQVGMARKIH